MILLAFGRCSNERTLSSNGPKKNIHSSIWLVRKHQLTCVILLKIDLRSKKQYYPTYILSHIPTAAPILVFIFVSEPPKTLTVSAEFGQTRVPNVVGPFRIGDRPKFTCIVDGGNVEQSSIFKCFQTLTIFVMVIGYAFELTKNPRVKYEFGFLNWLWEVVVNFNSLRSVVKMMRWTKCPVRFRDQELLSRLNPIFLQRLFT